MKVLSEAEFVEKLPALLRDVKREAVLVQSGDATIAVLSSAEEYEAGRRARNDRALAALEAIGHDLRESAAAEGISIDELKTMLDRHAV
jgi:PHD/YefM family antitoxin component YafN of YafNO toxin-antitoxin module